MDSRKYLHTYLRRLLQRRLSRLFRTPLRYPPRPVTPAHSKRDMVLLFRKAPRIIKQATLTKFKLWLLTESLFAVLNGSSTKGGNKLRACLASFLNLAPGNQSGTYFTTYIKLLSHWLHWPISLYTHRLGRCPPGMIPGFQLLWRHVRPSPRLRCKGGLSFSGLYHTQCWQSFL